jgi:hypothetical protein
VGERRRNRAGAQISHSAFNLMARNFEGESAQETAAQILGDTFLHTAPTPLAKATGLWIRGFHSKRSSSTASRNAATGEANVADIPPAAPATWRALRLRAR